MSNQRKNPLVGDLVSLHSPAATDEVVDLGVVVAIYPKVSSFGAEQTRYTTYSVVGKSGTPYEYDEPFWEARIVNEV